MKKTFSISVIVLFSFLAAYGFWEKRIQSNETTDMTPVRFDLVATDATGKKHGVKLAIPKAYLEKKKDKKGGEVGILTLKTEIHELKPWTVAYKQHPDYDYKDGMLVVIQHGYFKRNDTRSSIVIFSDKAIPENPVFLGYKHLITTPSTGTIRDIYIPDTNSFSDSRFIECTSYKYGESVGCKIMVFSHKLNLNLSYIISRDHFDQWRAIDKKVIEFVNSLKISSPAQQ